MAANTTRVRNLTPLTFGGGWTGGAVLKPFEVIETPSGPIPLFEEASGWMNTVEVHGEEFIIVPDLLLKARGQSLGGGYGPLPYLGLEVHNNTGRFVNAYRLPANGNVFEQPQSIPPGKNQLFYGQNDVWFFHATFTNELVGIARIGADLRRSSPDRIFRLTLTDDFLQKWRDYPNRASENGLDEKHANAKSAPSFTPRRIIGEKRKTTPLPEDHGFVTATVVGREFSKEIFNGRKNRVLRDVEIAGMLLRWKGSNDILRSYYGEAVDDIRSLTIYADSMEVADHLRFPGTNVTIYARELVFSETSSIDTTPLANSIRACSEFLTEDPEDPANNNFPADKDGKPTYKAKDGENGERGGSITLYVGEVIDTAGNAATKRFVSRGGKGQAAEAGSLKKYVPRPGYPQDYGKSQIVTLNDVTRMLEERLARGPRRPRRLWPGGETSPNKMGFPTPEENPLNNGHAVAVTLVTDFTDDRGHLPNPEWRAYNIPNPVPKPCCGRDAYPGGWPGDAGDGGCIKFYLASGRIPEAACDVGPGEPGDPTNAVKGDDPPGPVQAYALTIGVVTAGQRSGGREVNKPGLTVTCVTGEKGNPAKCRQIVCGAAASPKDSEVTEVKKSEAKPGSIEQKPAGDQSWAHPNVVCAVLRYARTAYRNGFRDDAATALDPYYALIGPDGEPKSTLGPDGKPKSIDGRLRMALVSVTAMRNNLIRNLDYYGNPPGWVPRLNALSNLQMLNKVRETAYETFYFADKLLRDYDALDNVREISQRTSDALKKELAEAKNNLQEAYNKIPESLRELVKVQSDLEPIKKDIKALKERAEKRAFETTKDTVQSQRIFSSAMQILGGIAKCLPVGQPFVGLAGSTFEAASQIDWNAEDPLLTARSAIDSFSDDVTEVMKKKKKHVAALLTKKLRKESSAQADNVTYLTEILEDVTEEPEDKTKAIEEGWKNFKLEAPQKLTEEIGEANAYIKEIDKSLATLSKQIVELKKSARDAASKAELEKSQRKKWQLEKDKTSTLKIIENLEAETVSLKDEKLKRLTGLADYRKKLTQTEGEARKLEDAAKAARTLARTKKLDELQGQLTTAKRSSEKQEKLIAEREKTVREVMTNLEGLGSGLSLIGNGIVSLATPLTHDDPTWKRLAEQMLHDDPELNNQGKQLEQKMRQVLAKKRQKVEELFRWQHVASGSIATITSTLGALTELSQQRQSIDQGLHPAVKGYLEETKERARDILGESIYWFVKSYQYEFLADVDDKFYNFDAWTEKLREMERTKKGTMAATAGGSGVSVGKAETVVLDDNQFKDVGDGVFKAETLKLGGNLLNLRQTRGENVAGDYKSCVIERPRLKVLDDSKALNEKQVWMKEMLDRLLQKGQISFGFVSDFEKGSFEWNDARVVDVDLTAFEITTKDRNLSLTIQVVHSGQSVIAKKTADDGREFFAFQSGKNDLPIFWKFVYNHSEPPGKRISRTVSADSLQENVKALFFAPNDKSAKPKFQDYSPGLFSDFLVEITDLKGKRIESINRLAMNVTISQSG